MPVLSMSMPVGDEDVPVCIDMDDNSWDEFLSYSFRSQQKTQNLKKMQKEMKLKINETELLGSYCFPGRCAAFLLKKRSF